jgi:predicted ATPase/DNA-binding SARP family transcriptional activator
MKSSELLQINLLGPLEIRRGNKLLELPSSKKARALLAYLIANPRKHRRDRLTELLWDVADDPKGGLRWCLTKIRPLVNDRQTRILADRETAEFRGGDAQVDLFVVREKLTGGASALNLKELQDLAALYRGSLLESLDLPDYDRFQAWLVAAREDVLQQHVSILRAITNELSDKPALAVPYARLLVEIDPLDEHSRTRLCSFLVKLGRQTQAKQLIETGHRLARELGGASSGELAKAERQLSQPGTAPARELEGAVAPVAESEHSNWGTPALVGRGEESARLRSVLENSKTRRRGCVVLITGEPGIGKTRLLTESSSFTLSIGGTVLSGRSYEAEARRPYGPWVDAIQSLHPSAMGDVLRDTLAPLLSETGDDETHGRSDWRSEKARLFAAVIELLAARAHSAPPVLLQFDDVQWCDEASAELLHYVVRMTRHRPVSVFLTARSGEVPDNEAMMRVLRGLRRDGWLEEMELAPLSREDTARLVSGVSPSANAETVFDESAGNPLYAIELARGANRSGKLADSTLAGLIRDRIDRLPAGAGDALKWAAVLGTMFSLHRLASLVTSGQDELMKALEVLDRHGLLKNDSPAAGQAAYGFTHNVVRRSVYDYISEPRRRLMHGRIVQVLEKEASSTTTAAEIVHHAALAGEIAAAARASATAGRYCLRVYAHREALAFVRSGMRYAETLPESERAGLQIELLEVSLSAERPKDTEETAKLLEALAEQALAQGDMEHARLGFHLLSYLRWEGGEWSDAKRHTLRAESVARGADAKEQVVAMAEAARCLALLERDLGQAEALALEAKARAINAGVEAAAIPDALGMLRFHQGEWEDAANFFQTARDLSLRQGDHAGEFRALEHLTVLELERNRPEAARALCRRLIELSTKLREGSEAPFAHCLDVLAAAASGEGSTKEIDTALESLRMADAKHRLAYALLRATDGDFARGDVEKARARGEEALRLAETLERPSETTMAHTVLLRCALAKGAAAEVKRHAEALRKVNMTQVAMHVRRAADHSLSTLKGV